MTLISTHVLDATSGLPAAGMPVTLTDADGAAVTMTAGSTVSTPVSCLAPSGYVSTRQRISRHRVSQASTPKS
jgi:5-hydroxyisourate hydrolase